MVGLDLAQYVNTVQQADGSMVRDHGRTVEPMQLQVVCRRLWASMPANATSIEQAHVDEYARVSESLTGYYAQAVREVARGDVAAERAIREWVRGRLIVDGLRSLVRETSEPSGGLDSRGLDREWIAGLRRSYLVRTEARAGATWHELSHDRFMEPVLEDNERWEQAHLHPVQVQAKLWAREGRRPGLLLEAEAPFNPTECARSPELSSNHPNRSSASASLPNQYAVSAPDRAAYSHCASVGGTSPAQSQYAFASYQVSPTMGWPG
ncbi:MAG: hypothetical protein AAGF11_52920 [Myxococcota bacterium]